MSEKKRLKTHTDIISRGLVIQLFPILLVVLLIGLGVVFFMGETARTYWIAGSAIVMTWLFSIAVIVLFSSRVVSQEVGTSISDFLKLEGEEKERVSQLFLVYYFHADDTPVNVLADAPDDSGIAELYQQTMEDGSDEAWDYYENVVAVMVSPQES